MDDRGPAVGSNNVLRPKDIGTDKVLRVKEGVKFWLHHCTALHSKAGGPYPHANLI